MTTTNSYISTDEAVDYVGQNAARSTDFIDDCINAASRQIDRWCGRHFYQVTEARTFDVEELDCLELGPFNDLVSVTTLKVDANADGSYETTYGSSLYQLEPVNAALRGEPYTEIELRSGTMFPTPVYGGPENLIQITGVWGWPSVPPEVKSACRILVAEMVALENAPLGTSGGGDFGAAYVGSGTRKRAFDMLAPYRHPANFGLA